MRKKRRALKIPCITLTLTSDFEVQSSGNIPTDWPSLVSAGLVLVSSHLWENIKFIVVHPSPCKSNAFSIRNIGLASGGKIGSGKAPVKLEVPNPKSGQTANGQPFHKIARARESTVWLK